MRKRERKDCIRNYFCIQGSLKKWGLQVGGGELCLEACVSFPSCAWSLPAFFLQWEGNEVLEVAQFLFVKLSWWQSHSKWKLKRSFIPLFTGAFSCESLQRPGTWTIDVLPYFIMINEPTYKQSILRPASLMAMCFELFRRARARELRHRLQTHPTLCVTIEGTVSWIPLWPTKVFVPQTTADIKRRSAKEPFFVIIFLSNTMMDIQCVATLDIQCVATEPTECSKEEQIRSVLGLSHSTGIRT